MILGVPFFIAFIVWFIKNLIENRRYHKRKMKENELYRNFHNREEKRVPVFKTRLPIVDKSKRERF